MRRAVSAVLVKEQKPYLGRGENGLTSCQEAGLVQRTINSKAFRCGVY